MVNNIRIASFNCKNVITSMEYFRRLCCSADVIALQETWLMPHDLPILGSIDKEFAFTGTSAMDTSDGMLRGRPYGCVALLWRKSLLQKVSVVKCSNVRLFAIKIYLTDRNALFFTVYMPTNTKGKSVYVDEDKLNYFH